MIYDLGVPAWTPMKWLEYPQLCENGDFEDGTDQWEPFRASWIEGTYPSISTSATYKHSGHQGLVVDVPVDCHFGGVEQAISADLGGKTIRVSFWYRSWPNYALRSLTCEVWRLVDGEATDIYLSAVGPTLTTWQQFISADIQIPSGAVGLHVRIRERLNYGPTYGAENIFCLDDVSIVENGYHAGYAPLWRQFVDNLDNRYDGLFTARPSVRHVQEAPLDAAPEISADAYEMNGVTAICDIMEDVQDAVITMQEDPSWVDQGGDPFSGFNMTALPVTVANLKTICENVRRSLTEHRWLEYESPPVVVNGLRLVGYHTWQESHIDDELNPPWEEKPVHISVAPTYTTRGMSWSASIDTGAIIKGMHDYTRRTWDATFTGLTFMSWYQDGWHTERYGHFSVEGEWHPEYCGATDYSTDDADTLECDGVGGPILSHEPQTHLSSHAEVALEAGDPCSVSIAYHGQTRATNLYAHGFDYKISAINPSASKKIVVAFGVYDETREESGVFGRKTEVDNTDLLIEVNGASIDPTRCDQLALEFSSFMPVHFKVTPRGNVLFDITGTMVPDSVNFGLSRAEISIFKGLNFYVYLANV